MLFYSQKGLVLPHESFGPVPDLDWYGVLMCRIVALQIALVGDLYHRMSLVAYLCKLHLLYFLCIVLEQVLC